MLVKCVKHKIPLRIVIKQRYKGYDKKKAKARPKHGPGSCISKLLQTLVMGNNLQRHTTRPLEDNGINPSCVKGCKVKSKITVRLTCCIYVQ